MRVSDSKVKLLGLYEESTVLPIVLYSVHMWLDIRIFCGNCGEVGSMGKYIMIGCHNSPGVTHKFEVMGNRLWINYVGSIHNWLLGDLHQDYSSDFQAVASAVVTSYYKLCHIGFCLFLQDMVGFWSQHVNYISTVTNPNL